MSGLKSQKVGKTWEQEILDVYYKRGHQGFKIATEISGTCFDIILIQHALRQSKHQAARKIAHCIADFVCPAERTDRFVCCLHAVHIVFSFPVAYNRFIHPISILH